MALPLTGVGPRAVAHSRWIVMAPVATRAIGFLSTVVLARLLTPADFGLMAYAGIVLNFVHLFQDLGLTQALIAEPGEVAPRLFPAFVTSLASGLAFSALLALVALPAAEFFGEPLVAPILWVMGGVVLLQNHVQVHQALLVRAGRYRELFVIAVAQSAVFVAAAVPVALAGFGVWALVAGHLASHATRAALLWVRAGWRPVRARGGRWYSGELLRSGGALAAINILDWGAQSFVPLAVGRTHGASSVGLYRLGLEGSRLAYFGLSALAGTLGLTGFAELRSRPDELRRLMLKTLRVVNSLAFPAAALLAALAPWIVPAVWGPQWVEAAPLLSVLALSVLVAPSASVTRPYLIGTGRLRLVLWLAMFHLVAYVAVISLVVRSSLVTLAAAHAALMLVFGGLVAALAVRAAGADASGLRAAVVWPALRACAAGVAALLTARALPQAWPPALVVVPAVLAGGIAYSGALLLAGRENFRELTGIVGRVIGGRSAA